MINQHRDSLASYLGHAPLLHHFALVENESLGRIRHELMQVRFFSRAFHLFFFYPYSFTHLICRSIAYNVCFLLC